MGHGDDSEPSRYSAFISYSHHDRRIAARLHRRIERYRLPRAIARATGSARLKPVFCDREELVAAADLSEAVRRALRQSEHLIVLCTPDAARSAWVGREIEYFRSIRGDDRILPAWFSGTVETAFPAALLTTGAGDAVQPLAADFTRRGDGRLALLKLIAALAHVGLDDLVRRDAQRRVRQVVLLAAAIVGAIAVTAGLVIVTINARAAAAREQARSIDAASFQLNDLRRKLEAAGRLDLLATVNNGVARYYAAKTGRSLSIPALLQRAELLQAQAKDDEQRGRSPAARRDVIRAWAITERLLADHPDDAKIAFAHAQSEYWRGFIEWRLGSGDDAEIHFGRYAGLANQFVARRPADLDWRLERGYANSNLGMLALRQSVAIARARRFFRAAQADFLAVARQRPEDADLRYEIADGEAWLADVERLGGDMQAALDHRFAQRHLLEGLLEDTPRDARYRVGLIANTLGLARIAAARGDFEDALRRLDAAHSMAADLAAADPENASIARQKRAIEIFRVQTWLAMPARARPARAVLFATLGDCTAEWRKPDNDELAAFCDVQSARVAIAIGDRQGAAAILERLAMKKVAGRATLSERWRLDLDKDILWIRASLSRVA